MGQGGRAFWIVAPESGEIRDEPLEEEAEGGDSVFVRTLFSAISRGTETLVYKGKVPPRDWAHMRGPFQRGEFSFPVKYGYSNVGRVENGPAGLRDRDVFCLYPHQTAYSVPASAIVPLPESVPPGRAVLAANMETAINATWDARIVVGDRVAVVGAGVVGCLAAYLAAKIPGAEVTLCDVDARKASVATALGVAFALPEELTTGADVVFHASGAPEGLEAALRLARPEGAVVELSWFGDRAVSLRLGEDFFVNRLRLGASRVGPVNPNKPGWSSRRRLELALRLLTDPALDALITAESGFDEIGTVFARLADPQHFELCHRIRYE
jgi:NADPH:quinone reductase-like Zn-dependent oxidoreductase